MTKTEFLSQLTVLLEKNGISDASEITGEYEQHFAFKTADGYSEEEIAAKLGSPEEIAAQYGREGAAPSRKNSVITKIGLGLADLFAGLFFLLLGIGGLGIGVVCLVFAVLGICLLGGLNFHGLIPPIPYWCGAVVGLSVFALTLLTFVGFIYYCAFLRQLIRSFGRFQHNALAAASGNPLLPPLPVYALIPLKIKRRLRSVALISLTTFAACFVLGFIASALSAGSIQFWHTWGWFGYNGLLQ